MTSITSSKPIPFALRAAVVTLSDSTVLAPTSALYIGGAGNVTVVMAGDTATTLFTAVAAGTVLPISVTKVYSTGTTGALPVVALW